MFIVLTSQNNKLFFSILTLFQFLCQNFFYINLNGLLNDQLAILVNKSANKQTN